MAKRDARELAAVSGFEFSQKWDHKLKEMGADEETLKEFHADLTGFLKDLFEGVDELLREALH